MKIFFKNVALLVAFSVAMVSVQAQNYKTENFDIKLTGTSNVHDWEMKAIKGNSKANFTVNNAGILTSVTSMNFTLPATNLKSKHKGMDKNTYKALNTDKNPNISFVLTSSTIKNKGGNKYEMTGQGNMTIAGTTLPTELIAVLVYNPTDKSFVVTGIKKMKMTDYKVAPPKALMGTIKTGNDITIAYNIRYSK